MNQWATGIYDPLIILLKFKTIQSSFFNVLLITSLHSVAILLGQRVSVGRTVHVGTGVHVQVGVRLGKVVGVGLGGLPVTRNSPTVFHCTPTKKITR
jgi:hypothetical protein